MESGRIDERNRRLDDIAEALPQRVAILGRLFLAHSGIEMSRTEAGVLEALSRRPYRITELAAAEGLTQPAISRLVDRLQQREWVARERNPADGRVVMVGLTPAGQKMFASLRTEYRALVHAEMAALPDRDVATLSRAIEVLDSVIAGLQRRQLT